MALTLTAGIGADDTTFEVTGTVPAEIVPGAYRFRLDDEVLDLVGFGRTIPTRGWPVDPNVWLVTRGVLDTTAATHTMDTTIEAVVDAYTAGDDQDAPDPFAPTPPASSASDVSSDPEVTGIPGATNVELGLTALAAAGLKVVTRTLSSAEIKALHTTPISVVVTGAGKVPLILCLAFALAAGGTPYSVNPVGSLFLGPPGAGPFTVPQDGFMTSAVDVVVQLGSSGVPVTTPPAGLIGDDWQVYTDTALTDGDGTVDVTVLYREITVP